ncbi:hypothetical protein PPERSA_07403 [Pseudocohnilembus persalinus]|uniref:Uncharacterized protein n=1 Tax=Pseudocohnilembus persalinus TaxID=266149 RepID=A0A0V0QAB2_PSEPJ|nr:hypothetical protein PPERSA_07403 [Pseudocohnilembus persalinus]|eukprot:KRW99160.1 hypothetical protein PPERSA_07403 [Pseudocohnilembus persalinus]
MNKFLLALIVALLLVGNTFALKKHFNVRGSEDYEESEQTHDTLKVNEETQQEQQETEETLETEETQMNHQGVAKKIRKNYSLTDSACKKAAFMKCKTEYVGTDYDSYLQNQFDKAQVHQDQVNPKAAEQWEWLKRYENDDKTGNFWQCFIRYGSICDQ